MFHFRGFSLYHDNSSLKIGTDSILLASVIPMENPRSVLDIGCGCGVIAFCLAYRIGNTHKKHPGTCQEAEYTRITGIDIDRDSVLEANANKEMFPHYRNMQMEFLEDSLQNFAANHNAGYQLIVSNPPYFHNSLKPAESRNRKSKHGDENLSLYDLYRGIYQLLTDNGQCYLILPPDTQEKFQNLTAGKLFPAYQWDIYAYPGKMSRMISCYTKRPTSVHGREDICIRDEKLDFTVKYQDITRPFYLW